MIEPKRALKGQTANCPRARLIAPPVRPAQGSKASTPEGGLSVPRRTDGTAGLVGSEVSGSGRRKLLLLKIS